MTDASGAMSEAPGELQLEHAEFSDSAAATPCAACKQPLQATYFEVNGVAVCRSCCDALRARLNAGSPLARFGRALGAGAAAAAAGSILYYAILALTGYEFGLIAIGVGIVVGKGVRWGSYGRGGWKYQTLAMALTYLSIVSAYVPVIVAAVRTQAREQRATAAKAGTAQPDSAGAPSRPPSLARFFVALVMLFLFVCATPFLGGVQNIMGILIIGFGLYQAWTVNRRLQFVITGPHRLAAPAHAAAT